MAENEVNVDDEINAMRLCVEGLDLIKDKPRSLRRVLDFVGQRYVEGLELQRDAIIAEIREVQQRIAKAKYDELEAKRQLKAEAEEQT